MKRMTIDQINDEVAGYQGALSPIAHAISRCTNRALDSLADDLDRMLDRGRYEPDKSILFLNGQADSGTIKRIEELARKAPGRLGRRIWESVIGQVTTGRLTNRRAIGHIVKLSAFSVLDDMTNSVARILSTVAEDGYLHGVFALQMESGMGWNVDGMKNARTQIIVESVFSQSEAARFIRPTINMADKAIMTAFLTGRKRKEVAKAAEPVKQADIYRAKREARTTITQTANEAHKEAYKKHKVKKFQFVATFDERTCPVCGQLDGKRFPVDEAVAGVNYPPMHPNCRCTTVAALSPEIEAMMCQRQYTDSATGITYDVPRNFNYNDWYHRFGPGRTDGVEYVPKFRNREDD